MTPIRNVVFMGMGEPLDNYDAVISAIKGMTDVRRFTLAPTRISVSTVGVVPRLRRLAYDAPGVSLALSLHAPTQELRCQIVPSSKAWHIDKIIDAMDEFLRVQNDAKCVTRRTLSSIPTLNQCSPICWRRSLATDHVAAGLGEGAARRRFDRFSDIPSLPCFSLHHPPQGISTSHCCH